jgi:hypothetical protein
VRALTPFRFLAAVVCLLRTLPAQESPGQAQIAFEGNLAGGLSRPFESIGGAAFHFEDVLPMLGRLTIQRESLGHQAGYQGGDQYIKLQGATWGKLKWTLSGGDFHVATNLTDAPLGNLPFPEITARGVNVEATSGDRRYDFFLGGDTIPMGPWMPFRMSAPQRVMGASAQRGLGKRMRLGVRASRVASSETQIAASLLPPEWRFRSANSATVQSTFKANEHLRFFGEAAVSSASPVMQTAPAPRGPFSATAGAEWNSPRFSLRTSYTSQSLSYFPVYAYFLGDRRGPFAEIRYRLSKRLEVSGTTTDTTNNLEHDPSRVDVHNTASSVTGSLTLPWKVGASVQLAENRLAILPPGVTEPILIGNRQLSANVMRTFGTHSLRLTVRETRLTQSDRVATMLTPEMEDVLHFKRFLAGGAVRFEPLAMGQALRPVFRGIAEARVARFSAHVDFENGNLGPSSALATNSLGVLSLRGDWKLGRTWTFETQSFRNWLTTLDNAPSDPAAPPRVLMRQWNVYFRFTKNLKWGGRTPTV